MTSITAKIIAPCGMNCALCYAHQRDKNTCMGCNSDDKNIPNSCKNCSIKLCEKKQKYCFSCDSFPCKRLKQLDKRYTTKYHMSMIENLEKIRDIGIREFFRYEKKRWTCSCGSVVCVHKHICQNCGKKIKGFIKK